MAHRKRQPLGLPRAGERRPRERYFPFPTLLDGSKWEIRPSQTQWFIDRSNPDQYVMSVPVDSQMASRRIRLHEMAHVRFTPNVQPGDPLVEGVSQETLNATEDARLTHILNGQNPYWKKLNTKCFVVHQADIDRTIMSAAEKLCRFHVSAEESARELLDVARLIAATKETIEEYFVWEACGRTGFAPLHRAVSALHRSHYCSAIPPFSSAVAFARDLDQLVDRITQAIEATKAQLSEADMPALTLKDLSDIMESSAEETPTKPCQLERWSDSDWGTLSIERPPLRVRLRRLGGRRPRGIENGVVPRFLHRTVIDQRVFARRRKSRTLEGTLLIDHSGSMSLRSEQVLEIVERWPSVTIATYSGYGTRGVLRIIAHKGRLASEEYLEPPGGPGNVVDGPALDWLARQKPPRVWISDGLVSGAYEDFSVKFSLDAANKVKRGRITRIENVHDLLNG